MKRIIWVALVGITAIVNGCSKVKQLANINVDIPYTAQVTVPSAPGYLTGTALPTGGLELPAVTVGFPTNSQEYLSEYGSAANDVLNVYLKSMSIVIAAPANQNFNYLNSVDIYLSTSSQPQVLVASASNIPQGTNSLNLTTNTDVNLKDYFLSDTVYVTLAANINAVPPTGESLNINTVFHLLANPLQ